MKTRRVVYLDTSALAKWYLNEDRSDEVEEYIQAHGPLDISTLTAVEMRSLLSRRRRARDITPGMEARAIATFQEDVRQGYLVLHPLLDSMALAADNLISILRDQPLRTLDALHLGVAREIGASVLATADRVMAAAAAALGIEVVRFD